MFRIRQEHLEAFEQAATTRFEDEMVLHIEECFPDEFSHLGEQRARELTRRGVSKARSYGITKQREVCVYIDLMIVFGERFDNDSRYPWAREILEENGEMAQHTKLDRLFAAALENLP